MATLRVRYLVAKKNRAGKTRYYWQPNNALKAHGWKIQRLSDMRHEALAHAEDINARVDAWRAGIVREPDTRQPGTIAALIHAYKNARHFKKLSPKTQKDYKNYLDLIEDWAGLELCLGIRPQAVQRLYEAHCDRTPAKAAYMIRVLRTLFSYAEREGVIPKGTNPATRPGLDYKAKKGRLWSPEDVKLFVKYADAAGHFSVGTAVMLDEWMGQRMGDVLAMTMNAYKDGEISITQGKTGSEVWLAVDMVPDLKARLDQQIGRNRKKKTAGIHIIQRADGQPYTSDGFNTMFTRIRDNMIVKEHDATLKDLKFMNLRHTAVTRLAESGCTLPEIAAITGHTFKSCQEIIDRYNVRTKKMARGAFVKRLTSQQKGN